MTLKEILKQNQEFKTEQELIYNKNPKDIDDLEIAKNIDFTFDTYTHEDLLNVFNMLNNEVYKHILIRYHTEYKKIFLGIKEKINIANSSDIYLCGDFIDKKNGLGAVSFRNNTFANYEDIKRIAKEINPQISDFLYGLGTDFDKIQNINLKFGYKNNNINYCETSLSKEQSLSFMQKLKQHFDKAHFVS